MATSRTTTVRSTPACTTARVITRWKRTISRRFRCAARSVPSPRPLRPLRGLRLTGFYDADNYVKNGEKKRALFEASFEHKYLNMAFDYLDTKDQRSVTAVDVHGKGWSVWFTPRSTIGWEGLFRYDHFTPNTSTASQVHNRTVVGVAYWFPHTGGPTAAFLFDYDDANVRELLRAAGTEADRRARVDQLLRSGTGTVVTLEEDR